MRDAATEDIFGLGQVGTETADVEAESAWLREHLRLPHNPFPPSGISPAAPDAPPLKDEQGREIAPRIGEFIKSAYRDRDFARGLVIIGSYGTGKSHLLRLMHHQINERLGSGDEKALSIYVDRPRLEAQDLNRAILKSLGEDTVRKMLWYCIRSQMALDINTQSEGLKNLQRELRGPIFAQDAQHSNDRVPDPAFRTDNLGDYREFLAAFDAQGWTRQQLHNYFVGLYQRSLDPLSPLEVIDAFVALLLAQDQRARETWESLLALGKKRKVPLMGAPEFLEDLLKMARANGYPYAFLLIDEFEEVPAGYLLTKRQKADYMYTLMEMLNRVQAGLALVLAITSEAWGRLTSEAPPLSDRLPTVIRLGGLDIESLGRLYTFYLQRAREDARIEAPEPLFPLSEALLSRVAEGLPEPTPRDALQFAYQLVSHCATNRVEALSVKVVDEALANFRAMKAGDSPKQRVAGR
jgi:hypothetical protein